MQFYGFKGVHEKMSVMEWSVIFFQIIGGSEKNIHEPQRGPHAHIR